MKKLSNILVFLCIFMLQITLIVSAHPGRTDKYGGHTDSSTGLYHYHKDDGSIVYADKPTQETSKPTETENTTQETNKTVIVGQTEKPLQEEVTKELTSQIPKEQMTDNAEKVVTKFNADGTKVIYITKQSFEDKLINIFLIALTPFALIGFFIFSSLICELIKLTENSNWYKILYVFYNIFWIPSLLGKIIAKLLIKINPDLCPKREDYYNCDFEEM